MKLFIFIGVVSVLSIVCRHTLHAIYDMMDIYDELHKEDGMFNL